MGERSLEIRDWAKIDLEREERTGVPEVVLAEGKKTEHLKEIILKVLGKMRMAIVTRLDAAVAEEIMPEMPEGASVLYNRDARVAVLKMPGFESCKVAGKIGIIAAGTSDFAVGEEARIVAEALGCTVETEYDVGVAGVHRLFTVLEKMINTDVDVYIVLAGREGALPTLVSGMVEVPVIGVPVSSGYGYGGKGEAALKSMLQSCSPVAVVNIDAGFIAAMIAVKIAKRIRKKENEER